MPQMGFATGMVVGSASCSCDSEVHHALEKAKIPQVCASTVKILDRHEVEVYHWTVLDQFLFIVVAVISFGCGLAFMSSRLEKAREEWRKERLLLNQRVQAERIKNWKV